MDSIQPHSRRAILVALLIVVPALLFLSWSQASLDLNFLHPSSAQEAILLFALSAAIFLAFLIFGLILARILLKLYVERRQARLGSRFKTQMVVAFLALSLVPVCFLFLFSYGLLNRSIDKWFGIPFDIVRGDASEIAKETQSMAEQRAVRETAYVAQNLELRDAAAKGESALVASLLAQEAAERSLRPILWFDSHGHLVAEAGSPAPTASEILSVMPQIVSGQIPATGISGRLRSTDGDQFLGARPVLDSQGKYQGAVVGVTRIPANIQRVADEIQREAQKYDELSGQRKAVKRLDLLVLLLLTLLILFVATWFAMFVSKQVTVPIQALAEGTQEISKGNLEYQVTARSDSELGTLIRSFNDMTRQLRESRETIELAAQELQSANRELEERGNTMEAILENIPNGVVSFDPEGRITEVNSTAARLFGDAKTKAARNLSELFNPDDAREVSLLVRRAARQGTVTRYMELNLEGRSVLASLTLSTIRARHGAVGSVLVVEDLSELLRAQKAAAWREVAQRVAHEIKNPLTPIQLSAERIQRLTGRHGPGGASPELVAAVAESATLIDREVATLKNLVDEFSSFARFPASKPIPSSLNGIIENALRVFDGRLTGIEVHRELASDLPVVQADPEQMKRAVVNLIDNAAEALENTMPKEIWLRTALDADRDVVELVVADSGPGIAPEAVQKLFLPYFSTKHRGTGLGLAIVSRIISEHHGTIRVEENRPSGAKFTIELPVERTTASAEA